MLKEVSANVIPGHASRSAFKTGETGRQLLQLIDQRMGVIFDDQIKKFRRGLLRLHIKRDAVVFIVVNEMDLIVRRSAGAHSPGNRSTLQDAVVLEGHIR